MESIGVGRVLREHTGRITSLDFTKDGELLLSAAEDDRLCVYSCQSGTLQRVVQSPRYGVSIARFTHDPLTVIGASRGTPASGDPSVADLGTHAIRYHSLHDNSYLRFFRGHTAPVLSLELSPKQDIFASAAADDTLRTWDVRSPTCEGVLRFDGGGRRPALAYDPQGLVPSLSCVWRAEPNLPTRLGTRLRPAGARAWPERSALRINSGVHLPLPNHLPNYLPSHLPNHLPSHLPNHLPNTTLGGEDTSQAINALVATRASAPTTRKLRPHRTTRPCAPMRARGTPRCSLPACAAG